MITYTSIMGLGVGLALILVSRLLLAMFRGTELNAHSTSLTFGSLGAILTFFGGAMSVTWPLKSPEVYKNFMFGEPVFFFGVLLVALAIFLWKNATYESRQDFFVIAKPVPEVLLALGLALACMTIGAFQYEVFATAPPQEPILGTWPKELVNFGLSSLYALPAVGCVAAAFSIWMKSAKLLAVAGVSWFVSGIGWVVVSAVVYYTHIAMDFAFRAGM